MIKLLFALVFLSAVALIVGVLLFRRNYFPVISSLAQTQVKNATSDLINDAIDCQIKDGTIQYDRMVYFEKDLDGRITALKTNMSEVNKLKTDLLNIINDEILAMDTDHMGIPVGSLFVPELFSGMGPSIPIQILTFRSRYQPNIAAAKYADQCRCCGAYFG